MSENKYDEPFGAHSPGVVVGKLIEGSRKWCCSPLLSPASSLCRMALGLLLKGPVDYSFRGVKVRFFPFGNLAETRGLLKPAVFDSEEFNFIEYNLPRGGIFLDVGANVGLYSLAAAVIAGRAGRVIAFEPNPVVYERLRCNIAFNQGKSDLANIELLRLAVTSQVGTQRFVVPADNLGQGKVLPDFAGEEETIEVEGITLLRALQINSIDRVDIMKIDIEGHELSALMPFFRDAPKYLYPNFIIIERGEKGQWEALGQLCREAGYHVIKSCSMNEILGKNEAC